MKTPLKSISIIPARGGSKGIPGKNLTMVAGKPLLQWSIEQSLESSFIESTYVSTDDNAIAELTESLGADVIWRPAEISDDTATSESALVHALDNLAQLGRPEPDRVVFLQCTSPLRKPDDIDRALREIENSNADSLISACEFADFLFWKQTPTGFESVNYDYRARGRRQDREPEYVENGSIYIFKPKILREQNNRIGGKLSLFKMDFWQAWQIDTIDDLELIDYYMHKYVIPVAAKPLKLDELQLLAFDFDGVLTDNKVLTLEDGTEAVFANRSDGLAVAKLKELGYPMVIVSTEENSVVQARADKLGIPCLQGQSDKVAALTNYCAQNNFEIKRTLFVGNDINDTAVMKAVGYSATPKDGHSSIKEIATFIFDNTGGNGVVRELYDLLLQQNLRTR